MRRVIVSGVVQVCVWIINVVFAFGSETQSIEKKKFIELGWDIPTTTYLREHWQEMEVNAPFDGVVYDLVGVSPQGETFSSQRLFTNQRWNRDYFKSCVDDIQSCGFVRYHDNFIRINFFPAGFLWTDSTAWNNVCNNVGICAWVASQTGGNLCFDFESYGAELFRYNSGSDLSFAETREIVRKRGAEFADAAFREKRDLVILCLWMNSINYRAARTGNPNLFLQGSAYGLLPSFIDGILDVAPEAAKLVEGCENGYYMNGLEEYQRSSLDAKLDLGPAMKLVSPENRGKYRRLVSSGFGFYLDMYTNPEGSRFYRGPEYGETRFERLRHNLQAAFDSADEYVWIYGEQNRWWAPEEDTDWTSWEEALPGITDLILSLSEPVYAIEKLKEKYFRSSDSVNLIVNGDFSQVDDSTNMVDSWRSWRHEQSYGCFLVKKGEVSVKGDANACYIQSFPAEPGKSYCVSGRIRNEGNGIGSLIIRWQDAESRWSSESLDVTLYPRETSKADKEGFHEVFGVVNVPTNVYKLVLLLSANNCKSGESVTFKDIKAIEVN